MWRSRFDSEEEARRAARWALVALCAHLLAALFSAGWNHLDEHFQILEFANAMLGRTPRAALAWEYPAQMRPALQPALYALMGRGWLALGVDNPFTWATSFRLVTSLFSWCALVALGLAAGRAWRGRAASQWVLPVLALTWFLPYLHARTSSENVSEALVVLATAWLWALLGPGLEKEGARTLQPRDALGIGVLLGLAFAVRYQAGVMVAGIGAWAVLVRRVRAGTVATVAAGMAAAIALGVAVDRWFYGEWVFAPWNYLRINVFEHKAASFGVSPWWMYFPKILERAGPPYSLVLALGTVWAWWRQPRSLLTWATGPFLLVHCALSHKEMRFLYPMVTLCLVLAVDSVDGWLSRVPGWWERRAARSAAWALVGADVLLLVLSSVRPAQHVTSLMRHLYDERATHAVVYFMPPEDPLELAGELPYLFYRPPGVDTLAWRSDVVEREVRLVIQKDEVPAGVSRAGYACAEEFRTTPAWWKRFDFNGWAKRAGVWVEYRCTRR